MTTHADLLGTILPFLEQIGVPLREGMTPSALRPSLYGTLRAAAHAPYAGEVEAIAWSFAAAAHLKIAPEILFHGDGYRGKAAGLVQSYSVGVYPGAHGLIQAGLAAAFTEPLLPHYPQLMRWLRE